MKRTIGLLLLFLFLIKPGYSQQSGDHKENFLAAESYFLFEEFDEALPLYLRLHRALPDNYNLYYKIGVCYLNNPYEKDKAVTYLETAVQHINPKYKDSNFKEEGAPLDALFFLGNAYRINNQLDKARDSYIEFRSKMDNEVYDDELVQEQLDACEAAEKLMKKPVDLDAEILSNQINTRFADMNSAISGDESRLVFISKLQFYDAVFYTEKIDGSWTAPRNITPELGVDGDVYPTCLSYDGSLLFVYRNDDFVGNLYTSSLVNGTWTPLVKLNENINTKYWESHACLSKDGKILYFTSNRKEGFGGLDIYKSEKTSEGDWGIPVNLGSTINTSYNEETPFITENGNKLFFSSYGHYNMGGYDIFMTVLQPDNTWADPVNLGYPVNTTDDDVFFCSVRDGEIAYYPVYRETGYGRQDIYRYHVYSADHPRLYEVTGFLDFSGEVITPGEITVSVLKQNASDTLLTVSPGDQGNFSFKVPQGKYSIIFDGARFEQKIRSLEIDQNTPHSGISFGKPIDLDLKKHIPSREELESKLILSDTILELSGTGPVTVPFEAEKGSWVIIRHFADSVLIRTDTLFADKRNLEYTFQPSRGQNHIEFILLDENGFEIVKNLKTGEIPDTKVEEGNEYLPDSLAKIFEKKPSPQENIDALVNDLATQAEGPLRKVLDDLDPDRQGIRSTSELYDYLYENAEKYGYSKNDVDLLLTGKLGSKDLDEFLINLKNASDGRLKTILSDLDPEANGIKSPEALSDYLIRNSASLGFRQEDVIAALVSAGDAENLIPDDFLQRLIHSADESPFKTYLKGMDPSQFESFSPISIALSLYLNSAGKSYTGAEVIEALTNLASDRESGPALRELSLLCENGPLKDFLKSIDLEKEGIYTSEQLIAHLYANEGLRGFSGDEINQLLQKYQYSRVEDINEMKLKITSLATGNFKSFLENMDLNKHDFGSSEEFIDYLKTHASQNGYSIVDVNNALLKLSYSGDQENIIKELSSYSDGKLTKTLNKLDPGAENIDSFEKLIGYLLDNSEEKGYTKEEVYQMISKYTEATDLQLYLSGLIRASDPSMRLYLESIDLSAAGITDRASLNTFLFREASEGKISQENLILMLLRANKAGTGEILSVLQSRSSVELQKYLKTGKIPLKDIKTAAELYELLLTASGEKNRFSREEVSLLFSEYLNDQSLNFFLARMTGNSEGNLRDFLQQIHLRESGITSVSSLIQYLISQTEKGGYEAGQLFALIEKTLGKDKLEDFLGLLLESAPDKLAQFLKQINLSESGISTLEDLMTFLVDHSDIYGYSLDDLWNTVLQIAMNQHSKDSIPEPAKKPFVEQMLLIAVILAGVTISLLLFLLVKRRKSRNPEE